MGQSASRDGVFKLPAEMTIHSAEELVTTLGGLSAELPEILVDGGGLERMDAAGLQLLVAWAVESKIRGKSLTLINASDYLKKILAISGADKVVSIRRGIDDEPDFGCR